MPDAPQPDYQAIIAAPFGRLGIRCREGALSGLDFLPPGHPLRSPEDQTAVIAGQQLDRYFAEPDYCFTLPLAPGGTPYQNRVWRMLRTIPCGQVRNYGSLAVALNSAARAVGQACGNNPIPIAIPCHRVIGKAGLGGFMHHANGYALEIKRWLLQHEGYVHD